VKETKSEGGELPNDGGVLINARRGQGDGRIGGNWKGGVTQHGKKHGIDHITKGEAEPSRGGKRVLFETLGGSMP